MTLSSLQNCNEISELTSKSLFIEQPKYKFTKIAKDLHKLMMVGCSKCSAAAYQTYSYCISMHPDSIITPTKIAASLKSFAEKTGGKPKSEQTIRKHLAQLEKVNLVEREYLRDKDGQFLGGIWRFFSLPTTGKKIPPDGNNKTSEKIGKKQDTLENTADKKIPPVIDKERVRVSKTNYKTNHPPNPPAEITTDSATENDVVGALKSRIKNIDLRIDFTIKTYSSLIKLGLTDGQIKTLIEMLNNSAAEGCGWLVWKAKDLGIGSIEDIDILVEKEKERLKNETEITNEAKKQKDMVIDGFKSGAQMMREAIRNRGK